MSLHPKLHLAITGLLLLLFVGTLWWTFQTKNDLAQSESNLKIAQNNVNNLQKTIDTVTTRFTTERIAYTKENDSLRKLTISLTKQVKDFEKQYKIIYDKQAWIDSQINSSDSYIAQYNYLQQLLSIAESNRLRTLKKN